MDFPDPIENSARDPLNGMVASVTTLFINVGLSKRPLIAGKGGLDRTGPYDLQCFPSWPSLHHIHKTPPYSQINIEIKIFR